MKERFAAIFRTKTRDEWAAAFAGKDACGAPVLSPWEAHTDPTTGTVGRSSKSTGWCSPVPRPGSAGRRPRCTRPPSVAGADADEALRSWGIDDDRIATLRESGAVD